MGSRVPTTTHDEPTSPPLLPDSSYNQHFVRHQLQYMPAPPYSISSTQLLPSTPTVYAIPGSNGVNSGRKVPTYAPSSAYTGSVGSVGSVNPPGLYSDDTGYVRVLLHDLHEATVAPEDPIELNSFYSPLLKFARHCAGTPVDQLSDSDLLACTCALRAVWTQSLHGLSKFVHWAPIDCIPAIDGFAHLLRGQDVWEGARRGLEGRYRAGQHSAGSLDRYRTTEGTSHEPYNMRAQLLRSALDQARKAGHWSLGYASSAGSQAIARALDLITQVKKKDGVQEDEDEEAEGENGNQSNEGETATGQ